MASIGALLQHSAAWEDRGSDSFAARALDSDAPISQVLAEPRSQSGDVVPAISMFLDTFAPLTIGGFDLIDAYAVERPETVLARFDAPSNAALTTACG
jgi:hypothetical protein